MSTLLLFGLLAAASPSPRPSPPAPLRPAPLREPSVGLAGRDAERECLSDRREAGVAACRAALQAPFSRSRASFLWRTLALKLAGLERWEEAVEAYGQALSLQPHDAELHHRVGAALLYMLQRPAEAEPQLAEAARLAPADARAHADLAAALHALGRPAEAVAAFDEALRLDPTYLDNRAGTHAMLQAARLGMAWPSATPEAQRDISDSK